MGKEKRGWRKLVKKLRRKRIRQKLALSAEKTEETNTQSELSDDADEEAPAGVGDTDRVEGDDIHSEGITTEADGRGQEYFLSQEEWLKRERYFELEAAMKKAEEEKLAITRAEQEKKIREEWEEKERKEKEEKGERERVEKARKEKQARRICYGRFTKFESILYEEFNQFLDFLCGDIEIPPLPYMMPEGYDAGEEVCQNFSKTGACRYFDRCKLAHPSPTLSQTILVPNFFHNFLLQESLRDEYDTDLGLEYEESELRKEFMEFYDDVLPEFRKYGRIIQFKVCCNLEAHLRGNVYIQYENIRSAVEAFRTFNGRFYNGRQISLRFVKIDSWRTAICWSFLRRHCIKGRSCNFLHVFRNPTKEFVTADRDWKEWSDSSNKQSASMSANIVEAVENSNSDISVNVSQLNLPNASTNEHSSKEIDRTHWNVKEKRSRKGSRSRSLSKRSRSRRSKSRENDKSKIKAEEKRSSSVFRTESKRIRPEETIKEKVPSSSHSKSRKAKRSRSTSPQRQKNRKKSNKRPNTKDLSTSKERKTHKISDLLDKPKDSHKYENSTTVSSNNQENVNRQVKVSPDLAGLQPSRDANNVSSNVQSFGKEKYKDKKAKKEKKSKHKKDKKKKSKKSRSTKHKEKQELSESQSVSLPAEEAPPHNS